MSYDPDYVPESLEWCTSHYVPPVSAHISCPSFGRCDGMNGSCHWCMEMTPYQHCMCSDETWLRGLLMQGTYKSRIGAIAFIDTRKRECPTKNIIDILHNIYTEQKKLEDKHE